MKITIKYKCPYCIDIIEKGEWVDLRMEQQSDLEVEQGSYVDIGLGVAMELPYGFEAVLAPRSSTFKKYGMLMASSIGVIDSSYRGDDDRWRFLGYSTKASVIPARARICQFRILPSQKASLWQKMKWLLSSGVEFVKVDSLNNVSRGGVGTTGV